MRLPLVFAFLLAAGSARAATPSAPLLAADPGPGDFVLAGNGRTAAVYVDTAGDRAVARAAGDFAADVERVTGLKPPVISASSALQGDVVIVGVLGHSPLIDRLAAAGRLDLAGVQDQWESTATEVVSHPWPGVRQALVVAGSDRRGAIYGLYRISEAIGVSPWYWWADVPVRKRSGVAITAGSHKQGPPAVKYRGIFLNDEDWGLRPWAAKTFDPATGNIGPKTYARICELLLRLQGNYLWPAMHPGTRDFNYYPDDKLVADEYAIVMGSSHAEPMLRDNIDEWARDGHGDYDYVTNRAGVVGYWEDRVRENGRFENVYTIGMRGISDSGMPGGGTLDEKAERLRRIIADQRDMIRRWVNPDPAQVPQIFCPYKEVLDIYRRDPSIVPDDVTLVWPDDNYGYIRQFSDARERRRRGGAGVYYHVSYWGRPYDYLWLCSTPPGLIAEEMGKAWDLGARTVWIVNVGDLKPAESDIEFFLQLAWNPHRWTLESAQPDFLQAWAQREFGSAPSEEIASVLAEYYRLNFARKPEHMGLDPKDRHLSRPAFSATENGDEADERLAAFATLVARANALEAAVSAEARDAYFELVLYPVRASALANAKGLNLAKYLAYAAQGRARAAVYLEKARAAQAAIVRETETYNDLAGGKWRGMMSADPRDQRVFGFPSFQPPPVPEPAKLGTSPEGGEAGRLPSYSGLAPRAHFVDVFDGGKAPLAWTARASAPWIHLSRTSGTGDERVRVWIAWDQAPAGADLHGTVRFEGAGQASDVAISAYNPSDLRAARSAEFVEDGGRVVLTAEHAATRVGGWAPVTGAGYEGRALAAKGAGTLACKVWLGHAGDWRAEVRTLPTWPLVAGHPCTYAISLDDGPAAVVPLPNYTDEFDRQWQEDVLRDAAVTESSLHVAAPGLHTLHLRVDGPGIVFDTIMLAQAGASPAGYLWPSETRLAARSAPTATPVPEFGAPDLSPPSSAAIAGAVARVLREPIATLTENPAVSPVADPHEYVSYGRYWWPDPTTPDGRPFVQRDGHHNLAQVNRGDEPRLGEMVDALETLSLGWTVLHRADCAQRAGDWLRAWFVAPATRMNPDLAYAQIRLGHANDRGSAPGILDGRGFVTVTAALDRLADSPALRPSDRASIQAWFSAYLHWLLTSVTATREHAALNNHGSWYLVQAVAVARCAGQDDVARRLCAEDRARIASQIQSDGSQPFELARVDGLDYSVFNLQAQFELAHLAAGLGVDLAHYVAPDGASLSQALAYLRPYNPDPQGWPGRELKPLAPGFLDPLLAQGAAL